MKNKLLSALILAIVLVVAFAVPAFAKGTHAVYISQGQRQLYISIYVVVMLIATALVYFLSGARAFAVMRRDVSFLVLRLDELSALIPIKFNRSN